MSESPILFVATGREQTIPSSVPKLKQVSGRPFAESLFIA